MIVQAILVLSLIAVILFGVREIRGWSQAPTRDFMSRRQRLIRSFGLFFLVSALTLVFIGTLLPSPNPKHVKPPTPAIRRSVQTYVVYCFVTLLTILPLIPLAFADARENIHRLAREQAALDRERKELNHLQKTIEMVGSEPSDNLFD